MLDLAMDIPMLLDTTTLARDLLMLSQRPRLTPPSCTLLTDMVCLIWIRWICWIWLCCPLLLWLCWLSLCLGKI